MTPAIVSKVEKRLMFREKRMPLNTVEQCLTKRCFRQANSNHASAKRRRLGAHNSASVPHASSNAVDGEQQAFPQRNIGGVLAYTPQDVHLLEVQRESVNLPHVQQRSQGAVVTTQDLVSGDLLYAYRGHFKLGPERRSNLKSLWARDQYLYNMARLKAGRYET